MSGGLRSETVWSEANRRRFEHWAWVPDPGRAGDGPFPLLVLLHGVYEGGGSCWWHKGRAHETLDRLGLPVVVLMAGDTGAELGSGYCDWADGTTRAETHLIDEVLPWAADALPVAGTTRHIAGLSMGGYGALLLALRHPGMFASASSTSGFFDPARLFDFVPEAPERAASGRTLQCDSPPVEAAERRLDAVLTQPREPCPRGLIERMWGGDASGHDVRLLVADGRRRRGLRLAFDCGTDDVLLDDNRGMHEYLGRLGIEHGYAEHAGGHDWDYWSARVEDHVRFALDAGGPLQP